MRLPALCVLVSLVALPALAEEPQKVRRTMPDWMAERLRMQRIEDRAPALRPHRRDTPLRDLNITDNEVREIQDIAGRYAMNTMLNISPVVHGCPCEEGPLCTDQVYVVATLPEKTVGLQLSRVRDAWVVGSVQKWWMRYEALEAKAVRDYGEYMGARNQLLLEFPVCALKEARTDGAAGAQSRDTQK
jgi:hypothetical protein